MIDTHAHLYADEFKDDIQEVIDRAKSVGVTKVLLPNIDASSLKGMERLVELDGRFFRKMYGLHPCSVEENYLNELALIKIELDRADFIAIGEIGIDLYWDKTKRAFQEAAFIEQCQWAVDYNVPIAIHSRESTDIIIELLESNFSSKLSGVFHCFGGTKEQALKIIDMGYYLGIGGVVTFKNSKLREELVGVPLDRLILETDAPYLSPVPFRGKRNESAFVIEVANELARIYNVSVDEIIKVTTASAVKLFKL